MTGLDTAHIYAYICACVCVYEHIRVYATYRKLPDNIISNIVVCLFEEVDKLINKLLIVTKVHFFSSISFIFLILLLSP